MFKNIFLLILCYRFGCAHQAFIVNSFSDPICTLSVEEHSHNEPIVLAFRNNSFLYPRLGTKTIYLGADEEIVLGCTHGTLSIGDTHAIAKCVSGSTFKIITEKTKDGDFVKATSLTNVTCTEKTISTVKTTKNKCEYGGTEIAIGFNLTKGFVSQIMICFDEVNESPIYSHYNLTKHIDSEEKGVNRPVFYEDTQFYHLARGKVNHLYFRQNQRKTINSILGLDENSTEFIKDNDYYLARGHLTAKADFVFASQQDATFHYINVAPQWQTFNGKNWAYVESDVRAYAQTKFVDLKVYTGIYGIANLPYASTHKEVPLFLFDKGKKGVMPVPQYYWKVVYNPEAQTGAAVVGLNNPYLSEDVIKSLIFCPDVSSELTWLTMNKTNNEEGYIFACDVNEFRKHVPYFPKFIVKSLLE